MRIKKPTLIVDQEKAVRNIKRIAKKAHFSGTALWPHFKTHQSVTIGNWFKDYKIAGVTVSSLTMGKYFAEAGWRNIYIAFPLNINEIDEIAELADKVELTVLVNEEVQVAYLINRLKAGIKIKVEIETGAQRSGVLPDEDEQLNTLLELINSSKHIFDGFYSHFGHTYKANDPSKVRSIFNEAHGKLLSLKEKYQVYQPKIALGDTPGASVLESYENIYSLHAGNYVFYDLTQAQIGVCSEEDIAIALAAPIVSKNKDRLELVVYGGGIHLSKESLLSTEIDTIIYGKVVEMESTGWSESLKECYVRAISQEHGVVKVTKNIFERYNIGDTIGILPVHSCMTADCMGGYYSVNWEKLDHLQGKA